MLCFKTILIPYNSNIGSFDEREWHRFLEKENPNIMNYQTQFCTIQGNPCWSILFAYDRKTQRMLPEQNSIVSTPVSATSLPASQSPCAVPASLNPEQQELYRYLKNWRRQSSSESNVPAYRYFSDKQMEILVKTQPTTMEELKRVSGLNATQLEKYGKAILDALKNAPCKNTKKAVQEEEKKETQPVTQVESQPPTENQTEPVTQVESQPSTENSGTPKEENKA